MTVGTSSLLLKPVFSARSEGQTGAGEERKKVEERVSAKKCRENVQETERRESRQQNKQTNKQTKNTQTLWVHAVIDRQAYSLSCVRWRTCGYRSGAVHASVAGRHRPGVQVEWRSGRRRAETAHRRSRRSAHCAAPWAAGTAAPPRSPLEWESEGSRETHVTYGIAHIQGFHWDDITGF